MNLALRSIHKGLPLAVSVLALLCTQTVNAQIKELHETVKAQIKELLREVSSPPLLELKRKAPRVPGLAAPNEVSLHLNIAYTDGQIWNPAAQRYDQVKLRSYQGERIDPDAPFVSPTLEIEPGYTIRINLNNQLPADDPSCKPNGDVNKPHCFNSTNLHAHGLWVNPAGNGDNVLISINPDVSFQYEYNVPSDHPAGTFWYHTHRHGSTALQVSSGMAGALIIRGNRPPTPTENGDIDTLLKPTKGQPFKERVLVLQQIEYACRDANGNIKTNPDKTYKCDQDDVGGIESYDDQLTPGSWHDSGRYTSINGNVLPTFKDASTGQIERWRVIHGGVRDTINLQFRKLESDGRSPLALRAAEHHAFVGENCTGDPLPQHLIAADGLTTGAAIKRDQMVVYQPAYRWDTLMVFPEAGDYCVIDAAAPSSVTLEAAPVPSRQLLGLVEVVQGRPVPADITSYLVTELVAAAAVNMPAAVRNKVVADLQNGLKLSSFVPHPDVQDGEVTGKQDLVFNIKVDKDFKPLEFQVNGKPFDPNRIDRVLRLGGVDEWTLKSDFVGHPFHIHVNPFQVVKILDPSKDVSTSEAVDDAGGTVDPQYRALKGVWKDTLWVKNPGLNPSQQYTIVVRTRYQRYIGDYVMHCHILDHEDQGMMQLIRVALPDGAGGTSHH